MSTELWGRAARKSTRASSRAGDGSLFARRHGSTLRQRRGSTRIFGPGPASGGRQPPRTAETSARPTAAASRAPRDDGGERGAGAPEKSNVWKSPQRATADASFEAGLGP